MKTSIIVPLWNHWGDLTKPFLESIIKTKDLDELILVDNGSTDATKTELKKYKNKHIKVIRSEKNLGFGGGNNLGYEHASGEYICFISNDVYINDVEWLNKLVSAAQNGFLVGPQIVDANRLTMWNNRYTSYIAGWCMCGSKKLFDTVINSDSNREQFEVFNTSFGYAYFEDVELSVMAQQYGGILLKQVSVDLVHMGSKSSDQINIADTTIKAKKHFENRMMQIYLDTKKMKRIVFFAANVPYEFTDEDYEGKGVGGAEASLILLARQLGKLGWLVDIYNQTKVSKSYGNVRYFNIQEYKYWEYADVFILFRSFHPAVQVANTMHKIFWSCDQYTDYRGIWESQVFTYVNHMVCISQYHKNYIVKNYHTKNLDIKVIGLGIQWSDYADMSEKITGKTIFCSVPRRGLDELLAIAPTIKRQIPEFELYITSDYRLWGLDYPDNADYINKVEQYPYIHLLGKIPRNELVEHQKTSVVMAYPTNYDECFCISAMECMAAGAVPVTYDKGAMSETVGNGGIVLSSLAGNEQYIHSIVDLLSDHKKRQTYEARGRSISRLHKWDLIVYDWIDLIEKQVQKLEDTPMIQCDLCYRDFNNSYLLNKHRKAKHTDVVVSEAESIAPSGPLVELPTHTVLHFAKPIECQINGRKYVGKEVSVKYEDIEALMQIVQDAYGKDIVV